MADMKKKAEDRMKKQAFSLIEMMVVLLIISIILAATAPIAAKKMARDRANAGNNPWVYTDNNGSVAFNLKGGDFSALIGTTRITNLPNGVRSPRLVLAGDAEHPAFVFARRNGEYAGQINMTENTVTMNGGTGTVGVNSVAIGMGQTHGNGVFNTVAIGQGALVNQGDDIAIGHNARVNEGTNNGGSSIAIGNTATAKNAHAIAIGINSRAEAANAVAIGNGASATATNSIAIGNGVGSGTANEILLGDGSYTVYIPGNLRVGGTITSGAVNTSGTVTAGGLSSGWISTSGDFSAGSITAGTLMVNGNSGFRGWVDSLSGFRQIASHRYTPGDELIYYNPIQSTGSYGANTKSENSAFSDKRLKNIGDKYTSGLDALKKLDIYNFIFKNDKAKAPHVGVIAQDLEKVFPNSVSVDTTGYLRIRWDEMFYAVINAVKELDARVTELSENVKSYFDETKALKATVAEQQKTIDELKQEIKIQNAEFEKRLAKLEKKK